MHSTMSVIVNPHEQGWYLRYGNIYRDASLRILAQIPFYYQTSSGEIVTHCPPSPYRYTIAVTPDGRAFLRNFEKELFYACKNGLLYHVYDILMYKWVDIHIQDEYGYSPLYYACINNYTLIVQELLAYGAIL